MVNLTEQLQQWHEEEEYQKIVDRISSLDKSELTDEIQGQLARAYNNIGGLDNLYKAVDILISLEGKIDEAIRLYRLGYSYVFLDKDALAIETLTKALELNPNDEDSQQLIEISQEKQNFPSFSIPFATRVKEEWALFVQHEEELRKQMALGNPSDDLLEAISDIFRFENILCELSHGEKPELIFTAEGSAQMLPLIKYLVENAPKQISDNWNLFVGRYPTTVDGFTFTIGEDTIDASKVQAWINHEEGKGTVEVQVYFDNLELDTEDEEYKALWYATILLDHYLGEIVHAYTVNNCLVLQAPKDDKPLKLIELSAAIAKLGIETDPQDYLDNLPIFEFSAEPKEESEVKRDDVFYGNTSFPNLLDELRNGEEDVVNTWYEHGATPCFFVFSLSPFIDDNNKIAGANEFIKAMNEAIGEEHGTSIGIALGDYLYMDFLTWDFAAFISKAVDVIRENSTIEFAVLDFFRQEAAPLIIKNSENDNDDDDDDE